MPDTHEICIHGILADHDEWAWRLLGEETLMDYLTEVLTDAERSALCALPDGMATSLRELARWAQRSLDCPDYL